MAAGAAGLTGLALMLWKFKFVALFLLTKAKFLLFGLTKASTFFSMFVSMWAYSLLYGWPFAIGLVLSIYCHELGHVAAAMRYGIQVESMMFVPFMGAAVTMRKGHLDPAEDARIALAGPLWGLGAAAFCTAVYLATDSTAWGIIGWIGAEINLINLAPIWILDGSHAFRALTRNQRWAVVVSMALAWSLIGSTTAGAGGWLLIITLVAAYQAWNGKPSERPDSGAMWLYIVLIVALSSLVAVPLPPGIRGR
jgi:Zn-dependent protease